MHTTKVRLKPAGAVATLLASFALIISTIALHGARASPASVGKEGLRIGLIPVEDALPFVVARDAGYYEQEGVRVELIFFDSAQERDSALVAARTDAQLADWVASLSLEARGVDVAAVSLLLGATPEEGVIAIMASPGSGIRSVQQLAGVPIAMSVNSLIEYSVDRMLASRGLKPDQIEKLEIPKIPLRLQMLLSNQIKAAALPEPLATLAEVNGAHRVIDDTVQNISQTVILFREDSLNRKGEQVRAFLRAFQRAVDDINRRPDAYRDLMERELRLPKAIKDVYTWAPFPRPQAPRREDFTSVRDWMKEKRLISKEIRYEDVVRDEFLPRE